MSFVIWVGEKKPILPYINNIINDYLINESEELTYVEPFLGSGIVLIDLLENCERKFKRYIACDINESLINAFNQVKTNHVDLIRSLERVQEYFIALDPEEKNRLFHRELFNDVRFGKLPGVCKFDNLVSSEDIDLLHACLFIFLNKKCFKGVLNE